MLAKLRCNQKKKRALIYENPNAKYVIKAMGIKGNLLKPNEAPSNFMDSKLEEMFCQNIEYFKGTYYLEKYMPLYDIEYRYYPSLTSLCVSESSCGHLVVPKIIYYLGYIYAATSCRTRVSLLKQTFENLPKDIDAQWEEFIGKYAEEQGLNMLKQGCNNFKSIEVVGL